MEDLEPADGPPPSNADIPEAGHDPQDPSRREIDEDPEDAPIGAPQQDLDATEGKDELKDLSDEDDANNNAAADAADQDDLSDLESELSEIDEAQFEDFDPTNIAIEERPVAIDETNVNLLKAAKRKRTADGEEGTKKKRKEGKREKPKRSRRPADDDDTFSGGEEIEGKRRRKPKAIEGDDAPRKERAKPRRASPENEEHLTPEERRKRALDRAMDEALKKPGQRRKRAGDITVEAQNDELIEQMRIRMTDAAKADTESRREGQPAMAKLKLLPEVIALLNRNKLKDQLVDPDTNLLEAVRFFLEPLDDGSLPAYNIQRSLFTVLAKLPITKDALVASGIGKVTWFYTKSTKPEPHVKRQAETLLRDWTRPILKRTDDYRKRELQEATYDPQVLPNRDIAHVSAQSALSQVARDQKLALPSKGNRARMESGQSSYTVVPRSNVASGASGQRMAASGEEAFRRFKARHQQRTGGTRR